MEPFHSLTVTEQLTAHLRQSISKGELVGSMPGIRSLASSLDVSSNTVTAALERLEREGFLEPQGHGCRSRIVLPKNHVKKTHRVTLLLYEREDLMLRYVVEIQQQLKEKGHDVHVAEKSLVDLGMNLSRIARMVNPIKTDAWVVFSAPREVLEWFVNLSVPTFALFGRFRRLPMAAAGLDKIPAFRAAIRRLAELGHTRIVLMQPKHNREPTPALLIRESLEEMEANGIKTGPYNLPDWEQSPDGIRKCIDTLLADVAPTAIIFDRAYGLLTAQIHLSQKGILVPRDISLICDDDPTLAWLDPPISSIRWDYRSWVHRVVRWVDDVANGNDDRQQSYNRAKFVEKGSVGPAP